ncbi:hypothetical protein [uncultured Chryseobacterium sp.]|uniref:hypothetical protein n=1 Tax=uncultured Chryseobacterium sp. TaxID=259322 RepID=UPI0025D8910F|nr:hypothetical protein [uncultured Chryseobacterium sp.]
MNYLKKHNLFFFVVFLYLLNCWYYYPFYADDSLISLRYVKRFLEGKGLTWNDGEFVEGYSNFLWILFISALGKAGMNLIVASRLLGIVFGISTLAVIYKYFRRGETIPVFAGLFILVFTGSFTAWSIAGLEQPLVVFLLTSIIIASFSIIDDFEKKSTWIYLVLSCGFLSITRPDGILFTLLTFLFFVYFILKEKFLDQRRINYLFYFLIPISFYLGLLLFRISYYHEFVPNTALVKVKPSYHHLWGGIKYLIKFIIYTTPFGIAAFTFLIITTKKYKDPKSIVLLLFSGVWIFYIVLIGGDFFAAFRQLEVVIFMLGIAIIHGLQTLNIDLARFSIKKKTGIGIIFLSYIIFQYVVKYNIEAKNDTWAFTGIKIGELLKKNFSSGTLIGVTAAGCIPYSSELPSVDMLGLNDYYLPRHASKNIKPGVIGHELGDSDYILNIRKPDIIIFNIGSAHSQFEFGEKLLTDKKFDDQYIKTKILDKNISEHPFTIFINKYGKELGIKYEDRRITIPYYLISSANGLKVINRKLSLKVEKPETLIIENKRRKNWILMPSPNYTGNVISENDIIKIEIFPAKKGKFDRIALLSNK